MAHLSTQRSEAGRRSTAPSTSRGGPHVGLRIAELTLAPGRRELRLEGEVDLAVVGELQEAIGREPAGSLLVDLEDCEFIDSTAIAALLMAHRDGRRVLLHGASGQVLRVHRMTGLDALGMIFESRAEALAELG